MNIFKSKTVLIAIAQAIAGVSIVILTEMDMVGYVAMVKSIVDIFIRMITTMPLNEKRTLI